LGWCWELTSASETSYFNKSSLVVPTAWFTSHAWQFCTVMFLCVFMYFVTRLANHCFLNDGKENVTAQRREPAPHFIDDKPSCLLSWYSSKLCKLLWKVLLAWYSCYSLVVTVPWFLNLKSIVLTLRKVTHYWSLENLANFFVATCRADPVPSWPADLCQRTILLCTISLGLLDFAVVRMCLYFVIIIFFTNEQREFTYRSSHPLQLTLFWSTSAGIWAVDYNRLKNHRFAYC